MGSWSRALRREILRSARVAVIGVGNAARGDDAAGDLAARYLLAGPSPLPAKALVVAAANVPENFTGVVRAFAPDLAVIVDSAAAGRPPGAVFLLDPDEIADDDRHKMKKDWIYVRAVLKPKTATPQAAEPKA